MTSCKPITLKLTLTFILLFVFSVVTTFAQDGKALFISKCQQCHTVFKDATGPKLGGVLDAAPYNGDMTKLYHWIYNTNSLVASDPHYMELKGRFGSVMTQFSQSSLSEKDIDAIFKYIDEVFKKPVTNEGPNNVGSDAGSNQNAVIFGVISLILAIIAVILMQVNSNLKKMSDDVEGINRPEPVPFYRNKVYIAMIALVFFVIGGFYLTKAAIGLQRQKDYEPEQPIFYSHKVHAGINQINCLYCHGNAWESRHAAIPSVNVCMNCHKNISEYSKGPQLYNAKGEKVDGTAEIQKLYSYAGFDPKNANAWDPSKAKPIEWTKIHSLPDHVYFNHSQHVRAGNVQCQTCHGNIQEMDEVKQFSELSMGWCVNCHRQTKVNFNYSDSTGNKFYSIYEKFHNDLRRDTIFNTDGSVKRILPAKMDSVTVKDIGGIECQKCHY
jgi:cytochrome c551/c552